MSASEEKQKNVLIRGVDAEAYRGLSSLARRMNVSVGFLASQAFKLLVSLVDEPGPVLLVPIEVARRVRRLVPGSVKSIVPRVVRYIGKLSVSGRDLETTESPVVFLGIGELIFEDDVTEELFDKKVLRIVDCGVVEVPSHIKKFTVLSKVSFVKEVRIRETR